jgi:hypothetical protein
MATVVLETIDSRPLQTQGGITTATRSFTVYDDATPITDAVQVYTLFGTAGLPNYGEQFPNAAIALIANDVTVRRMENQTDVYEVVWSYIQVSFGLLDVKEPNEPGYVDVSASANAEPVDAWRSLNAVNISALVAQGAHYQNGTPQNDDIFDIGGRPIDIAGEPVSRLVRKVESTFSITVDAVPNLGFFAAFIGRRNSLNFNGSAPGRVLYLGADIRRISKQRWSISHRFSLDEWLHMRQQIARFPDGTPILGSFSSTAGVRAQYVTFVQPFPDLADLYQISPSLNGF